MTAKRGSMGSRGSPPAHSISLSLKLTSGSVQIVLSPYVTVQPSRVGVSPTIVAAYEK